MTYSADTAIIKPMIMTTILIYQQSAKSEQIRTTHGKS